MQQVHRILKKKILTNSSRLLSKHCADYFQNIVHTKKIELHICIPAKDNTREGKD